MKEVILRGYYGRDNLGDELMKDIFIRNILSQDVKLYVMNSSPESLKSMYNIDTPDELISGKIPTISNFFKRFIRILKSDLYIYGGGTILTDKHSYFHLLENNIYFLGRRIIKKKSLLISVGATDFKTKIGKLLCRRLIQNSTFAYIRDVDSYNRLKMITKGSKKLVLSADMVLLYKDFIKEKENKQNNMVGLCLMPYYYATYHDKEKDNNLMIKIIEQLRIIYKKDNNINFYLIPIQYGKNDLTDYYFCKEIYEKLKDEMKIDFCEEREFAKKIDELSKCNCIISMRLHALMISKMFNRKIFAINHNEKIGYFMKHYDTLDNSVTLDEIDKLGKTFLNMTNETSPNQEEIIEKDYCLAKENINIINKILNKESK